MILNARILNRYDTAANWTSENPTLASGEVGVQSDGQFKIGNGQTSWTSLDYAGGTIDHSGLNELDYASAGHTGFVSSTELTTASGNIVEQISVPTNLLTNSGFGVWSNSTLENLGVASDFSPDNQACSESGDLTEGNSASEFSPYSGNTVASSVTFKKTGSWSIKGTRVDSYYLFYLSAPTIGLTRGKLYKLNCWTYDDTATGGTAGTAILAGASFSVSAAQAISETTTRDSWVEHTIVFEYPSSGSFYLIWKCNDVGIRYMDDLTIYEVTPGCIGNDNLAPEAWEKGASASFKVYREHNDGGTNTQNGSFYSLKVVNTSGGTSAISQPDAAIRASDEWIRKFEGRTVAAGVWVRTASGADSAWLHINDGTAGYPSDKNVGAGWEWLEISTTLSTGLSQFRVQLYTATGTTVYFSQPMLVFGSSIGEGNYSPIPNEFIPFEEGLITSNSFSGYYSDSSGIINLEAESNGIIPKGAKVVSLYVSAADLASYGDTSAYFRCGPISGNWSLNLILSSVINNITGRGWGMIPCDANGDIYYAHGCTGSLTGYLRIYFNGVVV